jgi:hypothetical protein
MHLFAKNKVVVADVKAIIYICPEEISVRVGKGSVIINGEGLMLGRFDENEVIICGKIKGITLNE